MMKKACVVAVCVLLFASAAGFAQAPRQVPLTREALVAILGPSAVSGSCGGQQGRAQQGQVLFAANRPRAGSEKSICTATATCESGTLYCEGNTSCTAVDRDCTNGQRGYVTCDGVTTSCPTDCPCDDTPRCCQCEETGDCFSCCRCDGGTFSACNEECYGIR